MQYIFLAAFLTIFIFVGSMFAIGISEIKEDTTARKKFLSDLATYEMKCGLAGGIMVKFKNTYMCMEAKAVIDLK